MQFYDVAIIGGGPAGLAVARCLVGLPLKTLVLERSSAIGDVWANHYEGLRLNTVAGLSGLAGKPFPPGAGTWPAKDDVAQYLADLATELTATVQTGATVDQLQYQPAVQNWVIHSNQGSYVARNVVLATGSNHAPIFPDWAESVRSEIPVFHSSDYRSPEAFAGQTVLVVGGGNSGAEIACRVAESASRVVLSLRHAPLVLPKQLGPLGFTYLGLALRHIPAFARAAVLRFLQRVCLGNYQRHGLPLPSHHYLMNGGKEKAPTFYPDFLCSVRDGRVQIRGGVTGFDKNWVSVGQAIGTEASETFPVDSIICATGFSAMPAIDITREGVSVATQVWERANKGNLNPAPGLHALGFVSPISGQLREISRESKTIAAQLALSCRLATARLEQA